MRPERSRRERTGQENRRSKFYGPPDNLSRIAENINVFDFELTADEMVAIDALNTGRRGGPEPESITLEAFGREIPEA